VSNHFYATESKKTTYQFAEDFGEVVKKYGFVIHNESSMDMAHTFAQHGV